MNGSFLPGNTQPPQNYRPEGRVLLPSNVLFVAFAFTSGYEFLNATTGAILADWWPNYTFDSAGEAAFDPSERPRLHDRGRQQWNPDCEHDDPPKRGMD